MCDPEPNKTERLLRDALCAPDDEAQALRHITIKRISWGDEVGISRVSPHDRRAPASRRHKALEQRLQDAKAQNNVSHFDAIGSDVPKTPRALGST